MLHNFLLFFDFSCSRFFISILSKSITLECVLLLFYLSLSLISLFCLPRWVFFSLFRNFIVFSLSFIRQLLMSCCTLGDFRAILIQILIFSLQFVSSNTFFNTPVLWAHLLSFDPLEVRVLILLRLSRELSVFFFLLESLRFSVNHECFKIYIST